MSDWVEEFLKRWATMVENKGISACEASLVLELAEEIRKRWQIKDAVIEAAETIYTAVKLEGDRICPHGITTQHPSHVWYCDDCWLALRDALEEAEIR